MSKDLLKYYFILISLLIAIRAGGENLPPVCGGNTVRYSVTGFDGSEFTWGIDTAAGFISKVFNNGDSVEIIFSNNPGVYNISVTEESKHGCIGPVNIEQVEVKKSTKGRDTSIFSCHSNVNLSDILRAEELSQGKTWYDDLYQTVEQQQVLSGGTHSFYYYNDTNKCQGALHVTVKVDSMPMYISEIEKQNVRCFGQDDGFIHLTIAGGADSSGYYYYRWDDGVSGWGENSMDYISIGRSAKHKEIFVSIADLNNCSFDTAIKITQPQPLIIVDTAINDATCPENNDGSISLVAAGGTPPYYYDWSNAMTGPMIEYLYPGDYAVKVTDRNFCSLVDTLTVETEREICLLIPTVFTPNNDGYNDVWNMPGIEEYYPDAQIYVFNRRGDLLFTGKGKDSGGHDGLWDGRYKGRLLPMDTYHFIIIHHGKVLHKGHISIVRGR